MCAVYAGLTSSAQLQAQIIQHQLFTGNHV